MKRFTFIATALIALASCSESEFVGENTSQTSQTEQGAIVFGTGVNTVTRADYTGAEAANKLKNQFVVGGFKGATSVATTLVFDNYNVEYTANTANTTESNTKNWEYVGLDVNSLAAIYHSGDKQTIKYWDYSQAQYDFIAYSLGEGSGGTKATATRITPSTATNSTGGAYTLAGTTAQLKTVHIADLKTVLKADYNKTVELSFRNMASKVRIALYETVPGYSVKEVKFYNSDAAVESNTNTTAALYASSSVLPTEGTYTIYFPTVNDGTPTSDKNKAHVKLTTSTTNQSYQTFGAMATDKLVNREKYEYTTNDTKDLLGRTSNTASYAGTSPYYQDVLPYEDGVSLTLKVDYTLISTDGSGETIKVVGAKAVVPAIYAQWKPGYAYTYIFKISDNTNGYTSGVEASEVSGLHAITFDAVVENTPEDNIQETVTTVATPSITTYQHVPAINASANDEYVAGNIYAMVMDGGTLKTNLSSSPIAKLYSLNRLATEAEVMDALLMRASDTDSKIIGRNGLELTKLVGTSKIDNTITAIPGADGNDITVASGSASKLGVEANTNYAYVYTITPAVDANNVTKIESIKFASAPSNWSTIYSSYYTDAGCNTQATETWSEITYYQKYIVNNGKYAVKVIKVGAGS